MTKQKTITIDYKSLVLTNVKENLLSFGIGVTVITAVVMLVAFFSWKQLSPKVVSKKSKPAVSGVSKEVKTYIIQEGDQLWLIAQKVYGSGFNMEDIMKANNITDPNLIEVGQKIILPDVTPRFPTTGEIASGVFATVEPTQTNIPSPTPTFYEPLKKELKKANPRKNKKQNETYTVQEGDDLAKIALQVYGDSYAWTKIAEANKLANPNILQAGTVLIIPQ